MECTILLVLNIFQKQILADEINEIFIISQMRSKMKNKEENIIETLLTNNKKHRMKN
jgi:hypothetical protein